MTAHTASQLNIKMRLENKYLSKKKGGERGRLSEMKRKYNNLFYIERVFSIKEGVTMG